MLKKRWTDSNWELRSRKPLILRQIFVTSLAYSINIKVFLFIIYGDFFSNLWNIESRIFSDQNFVVIFGAENFFVAVLV